MTDQIEKLRSLKTDYINTFSTENGKKVLEDLEARCFVNNTTFNGDVNQMIYSEGTRSIILHIKSMINMDIKKIKKRQEEQSTA